MYNSYEEYMQNVLGMNMNMTNTYMPSNNYYEPRMQESNLQEVNKFYPEIYGIVYPVVQKVCSRRGATTLNEPLINEMVDEVYSVIEPREEEDSSREVGQNLKNGDVKNPRVKEKETRRPINNSLRDLIRILIIRELLQGGWQGNRPRPPRPGPGMPRSDQVECQVDQEVCHGMPGPRPPMMRQDYMGLY